MSDRNLSLYGKAIDYSIDELAEIILNVARLNSADPNIVYRIKDPNTLTKKIRLKGVESVFEISDVYGFRVLVSSVVEAYAVLRAIMRSFKSHIDHDYIQTPKTRPNKPHLRGKSLRLLQVVSYINDVQFQVQITTHEFNEGNEALHDEYHLEKYGQPPES